MSRGRSGSGFNSVGAEAFWGALRASMQRLLGALEELSPEQLNWKPEAEGANSLFVLATHTMGNIAENVLEILGGRPVGRDREAEFRAGGDSAEALAQRWEELRRQVEPVLTGLTGADLERDYRHPRRGQVSGYTVCFVVADHAAEHAGQAELTRDLLRAR